MEVRITYWGQNCYQASVREHTILCDQPEDNGGRDRGMSPPELFLASLGTCAAYYAEQYMNAHRQSCVGLEVRVSGQKGGKPARITNIEIDVSAPVAEKDERYRAGLRRAVEHCLIHNTLLTPPHIDIHIGGPALPPDEKIAPAETGAA
jgi:uncharacterized OsmC-like protein